MRFFGWIRLSEHISVKADFQVPDDLYPWVWNPETGEKMLYPTSGGRSELDLALPRATSIVIVFESSSIGEKFQPFDFKREGKELSGVWKLQLNHINGETEQIKLETLTDLIENSKTRDFAGEVIYEKTLTIDSNKYQYLNLGDVQGISELTINGEHIGTKWYGAHIFNIKKALKEGENKLTIKLTTITGNYLKSLSDNKVAQNWTRHQKYNSMGIIGPVTVI
ncbi:hypothetical protein FNH22_05285 [Fulvivirga sp. M361]|uniref:glycosylhydrolase-like jelly roll fold domain-containing protein n=1 Tax=Fulvivirga sp. M361 TaxID=2594266 RepID=UPI00117A7638|nr:glycosylhydrolase-like jelly roll fold domain-containing protein [Fulvivirga sp. M361]TRX60466.1 hypothetical protein FNH22_05285 [Fulvivirga sp. M361]